MARPPAPFAELLVSRQSSLSEWTAACRLPERDRAHGRASPQDADGELCHDHPPWRTRLITTEIESTCRLDARCGQSSPSQRSGSCSTSISIWPTVHVREDPARIGCLASAG